MGRVFGEREVAALPLPWGVGGTELVEVGWVWGGRAPPSPCWALGDAQVSPGFDASPQPLGDGNELARGRAAGP